jgi:ATP-dependent Clp protease ATP-binding subunit ClpC
MSRRSAVRQADGLHQFQMFERFTESARRALFFARYEVSQLGATSIEPEHVLLGLTRESKGIIARILALSQVSPDDIRRQIESRAAFRQKIATSVEIPFSAETKRVLQFTVEEADRLGHSYIGTEHLLLALLREEHSVAASILTALGLRLDEARRTTVKLLAEQPTAPVSPTYVAVFAQVAQIKLLYSNLRERPQTAARRVSSWSASAGNWTR